VSYPVRAFDLLISGAGLLILIPLFALIAAGIKLDSSGPVFYRALRVGRDGAPFRMFKFRTMVTGADRSGPGITVSGDARVTDFGRFLRSARLDELPQLLNVLRGEMALVGPRPEDPRYVALYSPEQRAVLRVRPGITSPASLRFRDEVTLLTGDDWERTYVERIMPDKLAVELDYLNRRTARSDLAILWQTLVALLSRSPDRRETAGAQNAAE